MSHYADKDTQWALINATNLICDHVIKKLPPGWNIMLEIQNGEASASLFMPDGNELILDGTDYGISSIDDMCVRAIETEQQEGTANMRVRIEAVISTAGNDEAYVGHHLGLHLIGRPLKKMVVTFEDDLTKEELDKFCKVKPAELVKSFVMGPNAIQLHSYRLEVMPQS